MNGKTGLGKPGTRQTARSAAPRGLAVLALLLLALFPLPAFSDPNPANDSDSLTLSLTPVVDLGVDLDTAGVRFNYGDAPGTLNVQLEPGATAYLISPATITIVGNFNNQEVQVQAAGLDTWGVDIDETAKTDKVQVYALFAVNKTSRPVEGEFGSDLGRHLVTGTAKTAGETLGAEINGRITNSYEIANGDMAGGADMDNLTRSALRQLWLRLDMPPTTSTDQNQRIQFTVTAVNGSTN